MKVMGEPRAAELLTARCVDAPKPEAFKLGARARSKVERAMEALAPLVSRPLAGSCPECGEGLTMSLYVPKLVMDELGLRAAGVQEEIHEIASAYHWDEASILAMPQRRRRAYAEMIRQRGTA